jgi:large subunit ribosomal protein L9
LIPQQLAVLADEKNVRRLDHQKRILESKIAKNRTAAEDIAKKLESVQITITRKAGENDKLFGSVNNQDIYNELKDKGFDIDRRNIILSETIKAVGAYEATIKLGQGVSTPLKVWVVAEEGSGSKAAAEVTGELETATEEIEQAEAASDETPE